MTVNLARLIFFDYFQNGHITGAWPSESGGILSRRRDSFIFPGHQYLKLKE
jgi:hypothetical protein